MSFKTISKVETTKSVNTELVADRLLVIGASVERLSVSRMGDFNVCMIEFEIHH